MIIIAQSCHLIVEPLKAPDGFTVTAKTSTSVTASWQLPPEDDRNGVIAGFKLFYMKSGFSKSQTVEDINSGSTLTKDVTGLEKYTEYQFQVLAYTSVGDGPKSSVKAERTEEDSKKCLLKMISMKSKYGLEMLRHLQKDWVD